MNWPNFWPIWGENGQSSSPSNFHAEEEPKEHSSQKGNSPEESHAKEVEDKSQLVHDENMIGDAEQEQSIPSQMTPEETREEVGLDVSVVYLLLGN